MRSNMFFYLMLSVLIHAGMVVILSSYRLPELEEPEKTIQVEVAAIREIPMIAMKPTLSPASAQSFLAPSAASAGISSEAGKEKQPGFLLALPSPTLDLKEKMKAVSPPKKRFPATSSSRPFSGDRIRDPKPYQVKQPETLLASLSPTVDFPRPTVLISASERNSPVTVPSPLIDNLRGSVGFPLNVEPIEFQNPAVVEMERTKGELKTSSTGRKPVDPQTAVPAPLTYTWSFEHAAPEAPEALSESVTELPETEFYKASHTRGSGKNIAAPLHFLTQAQTTGRPGPAFFPLDFTVSSLSPRTPVVLPQANDPVLYEPPSQPPEFYFPGSERGAAFLLVLDTSGSVKGVPLDGIKRSTKALVGLMGENDRAAIMTFDDKVSSIAGFTSQKKLLHSKIEKLRVRGQRTLLFDALLEAAVHIRQEDRSNRHIFLFSDGKDEGSRADLDRVLQALVESNISVFAIGFTRVEKQYLNILRHLAEKTGGVFVQTPEFREMLALYESTGKIREEKRDDEENMVYLMVASDPSDARIVIDGNFRGNTPLTLSIPAGKHEILIDKDGFFSWEAQLQLEGGRRTISPTLVSKNNR